MKPCNNKYKVFIVNEYTYLVLRIKQNSIELFTSNWLGCALKFEEIDKFCSHTKMVLWKSTIQWSLKRQ